MIVISYDQVLESGKVTYEEFPDVLTFQIHNPLFIVVRVNVYTQFFLSNDGIAWKHPNTRKGDSSVTTVKPGERKLWKSGILTPKSEFKDYRFIKITTKVSVYHMNPSLRLYDSKVLLEEFTFEKIVENIDWRSPEPYIPPEEPPEPYIPPEIPYDKIEAAVVSAIKRRPIWHEVKENVFLIEVTDTVKQARDGVQSAWLVIDVNTQKMKVEKGWPSDFCTTPNCIVQRWLNGQEVQRTTIDGIRYLVTMPCSILILYYNGRKEHAGSVMSQNNMLTWLTWYGYIGQIDEDIDDESEESQSDTDTGETEKKDNTFLMLAAGGVALLLIGILLRRR